MSHSPKITFHQSDLDLDQMTLILKPRLHKVKMPYHTKNEISMSGLSKVIGQIETDTHTHTHTHSHTHSHTHAHTHTHTHTHYENITFPHMQAVIMEPVC